MIQSGDAPFWGKCKVVIDEGLSGAVTITQIAENSTTLNTEQGEKRELLMEGGEVAATRYNRNKYSLEFQEYGKASLTHLDGVVAGLHSVKLYCTDTGEDELVLTIPAAVINIQNGFSSEKGAVSTYTCSATKQETGSIVWA